MNKVFNNQSAQAFYETLAASIIDAINASDYQSGFFNYYILAYNEYIKSVDRFKPLIYNINDIDSMFDLIDNDNYFSRGTYNDLCNSCKFNNYQFFLYLPNSHTNYVPNIVSFTTLEDFKKFLLQTVENVTIAIIKEPYNQNYMKLYKLMTIDIFI